MVAGSFFALFAAGVLTFASPCVLPLIPMYLAVLTGAHAHGTPEQRSHRLRLSGLGFALGVAIVYVALGMGATALTNKFALSRPIVDVIGAALLLFFGAKTVGILKVPWLDRDARPLLTRVPSIGGFGGGMLFGGAFALGWTPCVGPVLGAALSYAATSTADPWFAAAMLVAYAVGLAAPMVVAAFAAPQVIAFTRRLRSHTRTIQMVTGVAMIMVGAGMAYRTAHELDFSRSQASDCGTSTTSCSADLRGASADEAIEIPTQDRPFMLEFVSSNCAVCKKIEPVVRTIAEQCEIENLVRVSVDEQRGRALALRYGVTSVPTFLSVDSSGKEVSRAIGEQTVEQLAVAMSEIRGKRCEIEL